MVANLNEAYYRKVVSAIGGAMLLFFLLFIVFSFVIEGVALILTFLTFDYAELAHVIYQLIYAAGYLLTFMLPVLLLRALIKKSGYPYLSMQVPSRISPWVLLLALAVITVNFAFSNINSTILFGYWEQLNEILEESGSLSLIGLESTIPSTASSDWILQFLVTCLVPGFCEEFFFRGAIQTNLRPFGRVNAILISAFLFAMMHQNIGQILYTFVAGIFLGWVYEKTGSIWTGTVIHILNNFVSLFENMLWDRYGFSLRSEISILLFEVGIVLLGMISIAILIVRFGKSGNRELRDGVFGKETEACDAYASHPISPKRALRLFLCPTTVIFSLLSILEMLVFLLVVILYGFA